LDVELISDFCYLGNYYRTMEDVITEKDVKVRVAKAATVFGKNEMWMNEKISLKVKYE